MTIELTMLDHGDEIASVLIGLLELNSIKFVFTSLSDLIVVVEDLG